MFYLFLAVQCLPLPDIENGVISYATDNTANYDLGTVATYSCNQGFFLEEPNRIRTCFDDDDGDAEGVFDGQEPRCVRKSNSTLYNYNKSVC